MSRATAAVGRSTRFATVGQQLVQDRNGCSSVER